MHNCDHSGCSCVPTNVSVHQTLDEMEWERGIWNAALTGDVEKVKSIISKAKDPRGLVRTPDNFGFTALHYAARNGHHTICELLIHVGAEVNAQTRSGKATPLHKAAVTGKFDIIKLLINNNACPMIQDADGQTLLHRAAENKHKQVVDYLLQKHPNLQDVKDNKNHTASDLM